MELNYDNLKESLDFFKNELKDFELCLENEEETVRNDKNNYLNRLIETHKVSIQVLEERLMCEIMCGKVEE